MLGVLYHGLLVTCGPVCGQFQSHVEVHMLDVGLLMLWVRMSHVRKGWVYRKLYIHVSVVLVRLLSVCHAWGL